MTKQELIDFIRSKIFQNTANKVKAEEVQECLYAIVRNVVKKVNPKEDLLITGISDYIYPNITADITDVELRECLIMMVNGLWYHDTSDSTLIQYIKDNVVGEITGGDLSTVFIELIEELWYDESDLCGCDDDNALTVGVIGDSNGNVKYKLCGKTLCLSVEDGNPKIPSEINSQIQSLDIKRIIIGAGITGLGDNCFANMKGIISVTIPNSVTFIGIETFSNCTGLEKITIPNSVINILDNAFYNCCNLTDIIIPNSVTSIGNYIFSGCSSLTNVVIPNSVANIGQSAFSGCSSLTNVVIPNSVTSIEILTFENCTGLTNVVIPNSVTLIGGNAFINCSSLTEVVIPNSVTSIAMMTFAGCTNLKRVIIPNSVTLIEMGSFIDCTSLTDVIIPNAVTSIGESAFSCCDKLIDVSIGKSVTDIKSSVFYGCYNVNSIKNNSITPQSITENTLHGIDKSTCTLMVPAGSLSLYQTAAVWKDFFNIVEIGVGNENENECKCDNIITQGNVSKSVNMWIVGEATSNGGTKSCYISNNGKDNTYSSGYSDAYNYYPYFYIDVDVNTTGEDMATISFDWKLEQGDINYVYIGVGITDTTTVISDVNLPSYIQTLDKYYYNDSIWKHETINIPAALSGKKRIIFYWYGYSYAYNNAGAIDNIIIHTNTDIGDVELDFENVSDIKTNGIKWTLCDDGVLCVTGTGNIPSRFENVLNPYIDQIKTVIIKDGIINIGDYAFRNLISLTEITIPDSVTLIGSEVFSNCISLTKVVIPNSVTTIGYGAFYNCISLTDLTIGSGISTLETLWDYTSTQESKWIVGEATSNGGTKSCYVSNNGLNNICSNYEWSQSFFYRDVEIISTLSDPAAITFDYKFNIQSNANWNYMQMFVCETNVFPTSSYLPSLSSSIKLNTAATWTQYTHNLPPMNGKKRIIFMWYHQYNMNNEQPPAVDNIVIKTNMSSDIIENFENGGGDWNFSNGYNPVGLKRVKIADSDTPLSFNTYYSPFGNFVEELYLGRNIENNNNSPFGTNLKKIEISSYVDNIPHHFCTNCLFLSEFEIPANINRIGDGAFTGCLQLKELNISDSDHELNLDSNTSPFGNSIEKVYMGRNTKWNNGIISSSLFGVQLKDITFSDKVDHLTDYMFKDCRFLSNDTTYPATIQTYGDGVFYGCQNLTEIPGLKYGDRINKDFFRNCTGLTTVIIPVSVTTLGKNCFADCDGLSNIAMPNTITKMEENVFSSCDSLTEFVIPNSITEISDGLLKDCKKLKKVMIPSSVTKIGYLAFYGCILLDEVNSLQSVKQIGDGAFGNCYNLTNVVLSGTITDIGDYCFQNCINLNNVIIPNTITKIGSHLFYGCTKLANVTLSNNITEIGESAFWQCIVLNSVVIPNSVIKIGNNAFLACVKLKNMIIPNAVTALENGVFRGSGIKSITIPDGVTSIGSNVFFDCLELTAVVIPNTVNSIGTNAFYDCSVLSDITNKSVTPQEINDTLFNGVDKATCVLRVPSASVNVYKAHAKWGLFTNIVAI